MSKTLIIAEKPSVATDLSKALAKAPGVEKFEKIGKGRDYYFENDTHVITSAVGHLVELKMPTGPNGKNLPWKFDVLPAVPKKFELQPIEQSETRLKQVLKLCRRKDIVEIINACDAGREGELIFQYILELGKIETPTRRLWMRSMTNNAILDAWSHLRSAEEMKDLADAAKCRSESDWLVGLNSTRALTCFRSRHGGFNITSAGRVQTPTLAILAKREMEIREFISTPYSEVHAEFGVEAGSYDGRWFDTEWKKSDDKHNRPERIWKPEDAELVKARCEGKTGTVSEEKKPTKQASSQLYDLTTLQREASSRFGLPARRTLQIAQALYEKHKMLTYPRTDSRYLPEDYLSEVFDTTRTIAESNSQLAEYAKLSLEKEYIVPTKRVFNDTKISDHFAIIPTGRFVKLQDDEAKVFELVAKRFLAVFFPSAEFENTRRITTITHGGDVSDNFLTTGKVLTYPGWLAVYGRKVGVAAGKDELVPVNEGEDASVDHIEVKHEDTKPSARYNEATLLSAMEGAGKLIEDAELREAMADRGLGTPATRASIIEALIRQKYIARDGREIHVSQSGLKLIETLRELEIDTLASAQMTGDWEYKLRQMEQGKLTRENFMGEIVDFTKTLVERAKGYAEELKNKVFPEINAPCPKCQARPLRQTDATYECQECDFKTKKYIASRLLSESEANELFSKKFVGPLTGFRSRFNRPFDAGLEVDKAYKVAFVFDRDEDEDEDLTEDLVVGSITFENGKVYKVYETEKAWRLPELITKKDINGLRIGRQILSKDLTREDILKMLQEGKTSLIEGFVSRRTKRAFSAFLIFNQKAGTIEFAFEERKPKAKKTAKKATKKAAKKAPKKAAKKSADPAE